LIKSIFISGIVLWIIALVITLLITQKTALMGPTTLGTYLVFVILSVPVGAYLTYIGMRKAQSGKRSPWRLPFIPEPEWYEKGVHKDMDPYIEKRVRPFVENLYEKSNRQLSQFYLFETLVIVVSAVIPIINVVDPNYLGNSGSLVIRIVSAILGGMVAAIAGYVQLRKLQESAIVSRTFTAKLEKEYHSFFQNADDYSDPDDKKRNKKFVDTVESLMLDATTRYYDLYQRGQKQEGTPTNNTTDTGHEDNDKRTMTRPK
jgi:hypothetical protein